MRRWLVAWRLRHGLMSTPPPPLVCRGRQRSHHVLRRTSPPGIVGEPALRGDRNREERRLRPKAVRGRNRGAETSEDSNEGEGSLGPHSSQWAADRVRFGGPLLGDTLTIYRAGAQRELYQVVVSTLCRLESRVCSCLSNARASSPTRLRDQGGS